MDYDFFDEARTRVQVRSGSFRPSHAETQLDRKQVAFFLILSVLTLAFALAFTHGWILFLLTWMSLALALGPIVPCDYTGGVCRIGIGPDLPELEKEEAVSDTPAKRSGSRQQPKALRERVLLPEPEKADVQVLGDEEQEELEEDDIGDNTDDLIDDDDDDDNFFDYPSKVKGNNTAIIENSQKESTWTPEDEDLLRKLVQKYPRGMLKRWEVIAEAFDGRHSVESIVRMSKSLGEKKNDDDSYLKFLAQRKSSSKTIVSPLTQRWDGDAPAAEDVESKESENNQVEPMEREKCKNEWTDAEDQALLHALKTFPKDTPLRWEKVALAVPSRTKPQCFKRYAELREGFRHKKLNKTKC